MSGSVIVAGARTPIGKLRGALAGRSAVELGGVAIHDGLWSTFTKMTMGESSDRVNAELGISREEQDAWAARSHHRADQAWGAGRMAEQVVAVEVPGSGIDPTSVDRDEGIRPDTT